ncbi:hypothetical protein Z043_117515, partial [Scleropages formosus]
PSAESMASLCQSQQRCVKASIESSWCLVEAQDQLCGLELHGSESAEQERARALAGSDELVQREREWRQKESMLGGSDLSRSPLLNADWSHDVFNKSIINTQSGSMLGRWDDSQRFLSERPHLICEETANYLILWCFRLQAEE